MIRVISAKLILNDGREIQVKMRERTYRKLTAKISKLSFWQKIRVLFTGTPV